MEHGPVLVITFQVFMIHVLTNSEGKVVEGKSVSFFILTGALFNNLW